MCSGTISCGSATMPSGKSGKSRTTSDIVVRVYVPRTEVDDLRGPHDRRRARASAVPDGHADRGDEHAAERDLNERARQRDLEVALAHERDDDQLAAHDDVGDRQRPVEVVDEERQRVERAAEE